MKKKTLFQLQNVHSGMPQGGKIQMKKNQLFSWLMKEGKTEASARLMAERSWLMKEGKTEASARLMAERTAL